MTTFKFGNGDNLSVTVGTDGDTYILGNGAGDMVNGGPLHNYTIILGNGAGDLVEIGVALPAGAPPPTP